MRKGLSLAFICVMILFISNIVTVLYSEDMEALNTSPSLGEKKETETLEAAETPKEESPKEEQEITLIDLRSDRINYVGKDWKLSVYAHFEEKSNFEIAQIDLKIDENPTSTYQEEQLVKYKDGKVTHPFTIQKPGLHNLLCNAYDPVGNKSPDKIVQVYVDVEAPDCNLKVVNIENKKELRPYQNKKGLFVSKNNKIYFDVKDNVPIKPNVYYTNEIIKEKKDFEKIDQEKTKVLTKYGWNAVRIYAEDKFGNSSTEKLQRIFLDDKAPEIIIKPRFVAPKMGDKKRVTGLDNVFEINVKDKDSGVRKVYFKLSKDDKWAEYQIPIYFNEKGEYKLYVKAIDNVGNVNNCKEHEITIVVVDTDPITYIKTAKEVEKENKSK